MNKSLLSMPIALLLLGAQASSDLVLTPRLITLDFAGVPVRRAYFMDGEKKFAVTMDNETELAAQGDGALFRFTQLPLATVELHRSPIKAGTGFSEENVAVYARAARQFVAAVAEVLPEQPVVLDPLPINGWKSCRFNFTYRIGGAPVRADVTFIDLNAKDQIVVITGSSERDYASARLRSDDLIRRWHEVTPEEESCVN
jgi:hypothetical protein